MVAVNLRSGAFHIAVMVKQLKPPENMPAPPAMPMMRPNHKPISPVPMPWVRIRNAGNQLTTP